MSGLEPIAALGLACNILQIVELGCKTIDLIKDVYRGRKPDEDLDKSAAALASLSDEVKKHTRPGHKKYEKVLLESAEKCFTAARDLREEVKFLMANAKQGSLASALKVASKVTWRKRRLDRLRESLEKAEKQMQSGLLTQIWLNTKAAEIDLNGVRQELRFFIKQYKDDHRETTELVSSEGLKTRQHISHEAKQTNKAVAQVDQKAARIVVLQETQLDQQDRGRFLQSLKYPGLNERRNQVDDAYIDSLKWVFRGDNDDDDEETNSDYSYFSDTDSDSLTESDTGSNSDDEPRGCAKIGTGAGNSEGEDDRDLEREDISRLQWSSFSNWLSSTDGIYWISGKPGSGKTTLVKYILAQERTRKYLDIWSPGCMIVSHYFWRPGSRMQKNLEGLFFSLLYQLLGGNATALKAVRLSVTGPKDYHTDWSRAELRSALRTTLDTYEDGVFLFLDGIDEIDPEDESQPGIPEFLDWAFELSQMEKIKLCLASRPDPLVLEMRLSKYPRLRLQDLNYQDLVAYAKGTVTIPRMRTSEVDDEPIDLVHLLVDKAEGVFLWLILATKSINRGIEIGDDSELLKRRIECLPRGLDSLYRDMWARVGADNPPEYRQTAALYFKALIGSRNLDFEHGHSSHGRLSLLTLMLATTSMADKVLEGLNDSSKLVCHTEMLRECQEIERKLNVYCFGLIELVPRDKFEVEDMVNRSWYGSKYDSVYLLAYTRRLQFIHRTARDFLTDTELGAKILAFDVLSYFALHYRLVKASLARAVLFASHHDGYVYYTNDRISLMMIFRMKWKGNDDWVSQNWQHLVLICEEVATSGRLFASRRLDSWKLFPSTGLAFLLDLVRGRVDDEFVISKVKRGALTENEKSEILLGLSERMDPPLEAIGKRGDRRILRSRLRIFRELLRAGADPNWQGCSQHAIHFSKFPYALRETPWQFYLRVALSVALYAGRHTSEEQTTFFGTLEPILMFLAQGASLDGMVIMIINRVTSPEEFLWVPRSLDYLSYPSPYGENFIASVPAHTIVKVLIDNIRYCHPVVPSHQWTMPEETLRSCQSLEKLCSDHHGDKVGRVLGRIGYAEAEHLPGGYRVSWFETTEETQIQLASGLMEAMKPPFNRPKASVVQGDRTAEYECINATDPETIPNVQSRWVLTVQGPIGVIYERLEELGLPVTNIAGILDTFRPIGEWVRKHREEHNWIDYVASFPRIK